jgi:hypothetical protein
LFRSWLRATLCESAGRSLSDAIIFVRLAGVFLTELVSAAWRPIAIFNSIVLSCKSQPIMIIVPMASSSCGMRLGNVRQKHLNFPTDNPTARQLAIFYSPHGNSVVNFKVD